MIIFVIFNHYRVVFRLMFTHRSPIFVFVFVISNRFRFIFCRFSIYFHAFAIKSVFPRLQRHLVSRSESDGSSSSPSSSFMQRDVSR